MEKLKQNWAQAVCIAVLVVAIGWALLVVFKSNAKNNTPQENELGVSMSSVQNEISTTNPNRQKVLSDKPDMVKSAPTPAAAPDTNITDIGSVPRAFFPTESAPIAVKTKVQAAEGAVTPLPGPDTNQPKVTELKVPEYIKPAGLDVYQVSTGNVLVVTLPWPEDRPMYTVTGFVIQRQKMHRNAQNAWVPDTTTWESLPKYLVQDEAKAGAPPAAAGTATPVTPTPAPAQRAVPRPIIDVHPGKSAGNGAVIAGATPAADAFDLKKYEGIYVVFDKVDQNNEQRYDYRIATIGKTLQDAQPKDVTEDGQPTHLVPYIPDGISDPYTSAGVALQVFAPGPSVSPTATGRIQVKFVSDNADKSVGTFSVLRGLSASEITDIPVGQEIVAKMQVLDDKGQPLIGPTGTVTEEVHTGLTLEKIETDADAKTDVAVLIDEKKVESRVQLGKTNLDLKTAEIDLRLLNQIREAREKEYQTMFKSSWRQGDTTVPVPAQDFNTAAAAIMADLKPFEQYYPPEEDGVTPASPLPQLTVTPPAKPIVRKIPVYAPPKNTNVPPPVMHSNTPPPPQGGQPGQHGPGMGDNGPGQIGDNSRAREDANANVGNVTGKH
ncbi:MAG: hypothetical protein ACREJ2_11040 [Planctomycetota bacterium]